MRPHWGKLHNITHSELVQTYAKMPDFLRLRQQLDPNGMFLNECLRSMLFE